MSERRYFDNELVGQEILADVIIGGGEKVDIKDNVKARLKSTLLDIVHDIERVSDTFDKHDTSVYTGLSGYALLYLRLYQVLGESKYLNKALEYVSSCIKRLKGRRITFLCGDAGPLAIAAVAYHTAGQKDKSTDCIKHLLLMVDSVLPIDDKIYDELLYGRAGYLYSLLYVKKNIEESSISDELVNRVIHSMVKSGKVSASRKASSSALSYTWHGQEYIGAAHGYIGILFLLLQANFEPYCDLIKSTTDYILGLQYPSGNFPSSIGSEKDRLIHWCHGAPGGVYLMTEAYKVFGDQRYLEGACRASDSVWKRGLLKKGYGLCHGASGNGYGFLTMFKHTKDPKYLYRAAQFGIWCCDYRHRQGLHTPDRPFSLFEGMAGAAYFLADLLQHNDAKFPAFEL